MKVYLAGPYAARDWMRADAAHLLEAADHTVTSRWLQSRHAIEIGVVDAAPAHTDEYTTLHTQEDFADIDAADAVLLFTSHWVIVNCGLSLGQTISGGRHIETGYALAQGKLVIVVGPAENIFHRGACALAEDLPAALAILAEMDEQNTCGSCQEGWDGPSSVCPKSERLCGHHCNHSWESDKCCWCDKEFGEDVGRTT